MLYISCCIYASLYHTARYISLYHTVWLCTIHTVLCSVYGSAQYTPYCAVCMALHNTHRTVQCVWHCTIHIVLCSVYSTAQYTPYCAMCMMIYNAYAAAQYTSYCALRRREPRIQRGPIYPSARIVRWDRQYISSRQEKFNSAIQMSQQIHPGTVY
jgi:hypothetical protein